MHPNGQSIVHPDALALAKKLMESGVPSEYFALREPTLELFVVGCESPIEQMLAIAIAFVQPNFMHVAN